MALIIYFIQIQFRNMKAMAGVTAKARKTARERLHETNEQMRQISEYQNQYYQEAEDWNEQQGYVELILLQILSAYLILYTLYYLLYICCYVLNFLYMNQTINYKSFFFQPLSIHPSILNSIIQV